MGGRSVGPSKEIWAHILDKWEDLKWFVGLEVDSLLALRN